MVNLKSYFVNLIHFTCSKTLFTVSFNYFYTLILLVRIIEMMKKTTNFAWRTKRFESNLLLLYVFVCLFFSAL